MLQPTHYRIHALLMLLVPAASASAGALRGDIDLDNDIDLVDYSLFVDCVTGPDGGPVVGPCTAADFDGDTDVDVLDWSGLQDVFGFIATTPSPVPAVSEWGTVVLSLLLLTGITLQSRRRAAATQTRHTHR